MIAHDLQRGSAISIWLEGEINITGSVFFDNKCRGHGTVHGGLSAKMTVTSSRFENNIAYGVGTGVIAEEEAQLTITGCRFDTNLAFGVSSSSSLSLFPSRE